MALFDRRLLAYLDDGGWAGSGTFHDRIVGYQQDLNEIERELYKYQHVLGPGRVKLKARDRRGWFSQHRQSPTTAEIFGNQLEPHPVVSQHQPAQPAVAQAPSVTGAADLVAEPANPARLRRLSAPTASPKPSPKPSPRPSLTEPLQPGTSAPTQPERRQSHRLPVPSRRPSATAEPSPAKVVDVPKVQPKAPAAKAAEAPPAVSEETPLARLQSLPRSELPTHWAQVDTLYLSWDMLLAVGTQLIVRGHWVGKDKETQLDPRAVQAQEGDNQFPQKCKVRQQLKLDGASDVRVIELQILEYRLDGEKVLGKVWLDAMEGDHHKKTVQEPLYGEDGRKLSSQLLVKLATMGSSTVVSQDPVASSAGTKEVPRIRVVQAPGAQTGPVVQAVVAGKPAATAEPDPSEQQVSDSNEEEEEEFIYEEAAEEEPPDDDEVVTEDPSKG